MFADSNPTIYADMSRLLSRPRAKHEESVIVYPCKAHYIFVLLLEMTLEFAACGLQFRKSLLSE